MQPTIPEHLVGLWGTAMRSICAPGHRVLRGGKRQKGEESSAQSGYCGEDKSNGQKGFQVDIEMRAEVRSHPGDLGDMPVSE